MKFHLSIESGEVLVEHPHSIYLKGYGGYNDNNYYYNFKFIYSDIENDNLGVSDEVKEKLVTELRNVFGFGPNNNVKVESIIEEGVNILFNVKQ